MFTTTGSTAGTAPPLVSVIWPLCQPCAVAVPSTRMRSFCVWPGRSVNRAGCTVTFSPSAPVAAAENARVRPETFFAVRVVSSAPGSGFTAMLGRSRSTRCSGSVALAAMSFAETSNVSVGCTARSARMEPAPRSNTPAALPSALTTCCSEEVISADFTCPGVQSGCAARTRAEMPVACGLDIEVPAIAWYSWPFGPAGMSTGVGVFPASTWTPGAVMSGLRKSPTGPRELNPAITSPVAGVNAPVAQVAVTPACAARKASSSSLGPSRWMAGRKWLSVSVSEAVGLYRTMPAAPPWLAKYPFSTRPPPPPPRSQTTTLPVSEPASNGLRQYWPPV